MAQKFTAQQVADAITETRGFITYTAKRLGCDRSTVYSYINKYAVCKKALEDARETMLDTAEMRLWEQINAGDTTAIIFTLKTIGKGRGYVERQELTGADGGPIKGYALFDPSAWDDDED